MFFSPMRLSLLAASAFAVTLAACGGSNEAADTDTAEAAGNAGAAETAEAAGSAENAGAVVAQARACSGEASDVIASFTAPDVAQDADAPAANAALAAAFLEHAASAPCVFAFENGLMFRIDEAVNDAAPSPNSGELVEVHYEGRLLDGTVFDSSYERDQPAVFPSDRLIRGWVQSLPEMKVGESWTLMIPPELAYGERGTPGGPIPPNAALVFKVELLGLPGRETPEAPAENSDGR